MRVAFGLKWFGDATHDVENANLRDRAIPKAKQKVTELCGGNCPPGGNVVPSVSPYGVGGLGVLRRLQKSRTDQPPNC